MKPLPILLIAAFTALACNSNQEHHGTMGTVNLSESTDVVVFCEGTSPKIAAPGCPLGSTVSTDACSECVMSSNGDPSECDDTVTFPRKSPCSGAECFNVDLCPCGDGLCQPPQ